MKEFLKRNKKKIGTGGAILFLFLLIASIKITKDRVIGYDLELINCSDDTDLIVFFWDEENKIPAFPNGDSVLVAREVQEKCCKKVDLMNGSCTNDHLVVETDTFKTGWWVEFRTDTTEKMLAEPPVGYYFEFSEHILANKYEVIAIADTIQVEEEVFQNGKKDTVNIAIPQFIYRYKVDFRIKIDYSEYFRSLKYLWDFIWGNPIPGNRLHIHVTGHPCEPKPSDPPGTCDG